MCEMWQIDVLTFDKIDLFLWNLVWDSSSKTGHHFFGVQRKVNSQIPFLVTVLRCFPSPSLTFRSFSHYMCMLSMLNPPLTLKNSNIMSRNPHVLGNWEQIRGAVHHSFSRFFSPRWHGSHKPQSFTLRRGESVWRDPAQPSRSPGTVFLFIARIWRI